MKIAIPTAGGKLCMHFGHCEKFALVDVDVDNKKIKSTEYVTPPPHEPGLYPKWLSEKGAHFIIAGGMGQRAQQFFNEYNIKVITGASSDSPENVVNAFLNDTLDVGPNVCDH
ncbi:MAG: NifB/NifX family molybdenum-iron cluster-binding protein [Spirochaetes bacterium]|jgi:predicted Fe-Mo cluster-binding NifX family protein|nr:NifB/NifX family molybdenum-iron cluster-binding protein [Spirochaetota bacterium]